MKEFRRKFLMPRSGGFAVAAEKGTPIRRLLGMLVLSAVMGTAVPSASVWAEDLSIALGSAITSLDPHFANNSPNKAVARHFFEALIAFDPQSNLVPALAASWKRISDTEWEFKLRSGVKFSDGSTLTADDVVVSFARAPAVPNSPSSLGLFTRSIAQVKAVDPSTVVIETKYPDPLLPRMVPEILIISAALKDAETRDYNSGKAMVGTGPFVFQAYTPGDRLIMRRNEDYWGEQPDWNKVTLRFITNEATRVAALLSGDADLIENVSPNLMDRVKGGNFSIVQSPPALPVYIGLDVGRDETPFVKAKSPDAGANPNPLRDKRVRQALSYGIDREAISARLMQGTTTPTGQMLHDSLFGASPKVVAPQYDPEKAKQLLAEAGYKNGLMLTFHGPNDRLTNDSRVVQAVAQMWNRIGVEASAQVMPWSVYFPQTGKREFSLWMMSSGAVSEMGTALNSVVVTHDPQSRRGVNNRGRYSNAQIDTLVNASFQTLDDDERRAMLQKASELTFEEMPVIPLYFYSFAIASKKNIVYKPRMDQFTLAWGARLAQ